MFRFLLCFLFALHSKKILCVQRSEFFSIYNELENLYPALSPIFEEKSKSLVQCVIVCASRLDCFSVARKCSSHICQGFGNPFLFNNGYTISNVTWHVKEVAEACSKDGYTWNSTYRICYKYHSTTMSIGRARSTCEGETARLLLLTSDRVHDFAEWFARTYSTGSLYVQGSRKTIYISDYFDDQAREMEDLKWSSGEPSDDGIYMRLNTEFYRLEATPGSTNRRFICQRGQL